MNKLNLFAGVFILSAIFLFGCSSNECDCSDSYPSTYPSSSSVNAAPSSSSSGGLVVQDQDLVKKYITLSSGSGYADIDGEPLAYTEDDAANNLKKIDLIAYCSVNMGCKNNSLYSPWEIKLFWDYPDYLGKNIYIFEVPDEQAGVFKTAKRLYDILQTYNDLVSTFSGAGVDEIPIKEGSVFFISTSESNIDIIIIKQANEQSVDLEIIEMPFH